MLTLSSCSMPAALISTAARVSASHLASIRALRCQVHGAGTDGERGDGRALDDAVRIEADQRPVLERGRFALGAVDDDEARAGAAVANRRPLPAGREAGAAAAAQTRTR